MNHANHLSKGRVAGVLLGMATVAMSLYMPVEQFHNSPADLAQYKPTRREPPRRPPRSLTEQPQILATGPSTQIVFEG